MCSRRWMLGAMLFSSAAYLAEAGNSVVDVTQQGVVGDGQTDVTEALRSLLSRASAGQTLFFPSGEYVAPAGTTLYIDKSVKLLGEGAELVNLRLFFLADVDVDGLSLSEVDCLHHQSNPSACPAAGAMITAGYIGYPLTSVSIRNVNIATTRAYTGIELGYDQVANVNIDQFSIIDHELSAISIYGGEHIRISNGTIQGGMEPIVDDGIAISPYYGPISDVVISNVSAIQAADLVGLGSNLFFPVTNVSITNSTCRSTIACLFFRLGEESRPPAPYTQYSYVDGVTVDGIRDTDPNGERYQASVLLEARGGAAGRNISISNVVASSRPASPFGFRVQAFLDGGSQLHNVAFVNCSFDDSFNGAEHSPAAPGYPADEGIFLQTDATSRIDGLIVRNVHLAGTAYWGIDAGSASIASLQVINPDFHDIFLTQPGWSGSPFYIPNSVPTSVGGQ